MTHSQGPSADFVKQLNKHYPAIRAFGIRLTSSYDAGEDLAQTTYLKAIANFHRFEEGTTIKSWLFTILRNEYYTLYRKRKRERPLEQGVIDNIPDDRHRRDEIEHLGEFSNVAPLLSLISREQCDCVIATQYLDMSYEATAATFNIAVGTVKSRVNRGIEHLGELAREQDVAAFDLSSWQSATYGLSKENPYYPIAEAYEAIYREVVANASHRLIMPPKAELARSKLDSVWDDLVQSGALSEEVFSLHDLMR